MFPVSDESFFGFVGDCSAFEVGVFGRFEMVFVASFFDVVSEPQFVSVFEELMGFEKEITYENSQVPPSRLIFYFLSSSERL